jgi:hypothetical protein
MRKDVGRKAADAVEIVVHLILGSAAHA